MKKSVKIMSSCLVVIFALTSLSYGQDEVKIRRTQKLHFDDESKKAEIKVEVTKEYNYVVFDIQSQLYKGEIKVEIFDPNGDKQGSFTVKADDGTVSGDNTRAESSVRGQMAKVFGKPLNGEWKIKADPASAIGDLVAFTTLGFEPRIDLIDLRTLK